MTASARSLFPLAIVLLALLPVPYAAAEGCVNFRLGKAYGLQIIGDAESDIVMLGLGVPDPGEGTRVVAWIRPNVCTGSMLAPDLVGLTSASAQPAEVPSGVPVFIPLP